jgi:tetratricopeptide (TPR) repeat protein
VDKATKQQLKKQDKFHVLTEQSIDWASHNRQKAITSGVIAAVVILLLVAAGTFYAHRSTQADSALGDAMQTYQTPVATAGQQLPAGMKSFATIKDRAAAANAQFASVANQYGMTKAGKIAEYFVGVTYMEEGQNASAEDALKKAGSCWDSGVSALSKLALAQLYQQTGRDGLAKDLYDQLAKSNATTVPAGLAQIQLGEMYQAEGKTEQARQIFAQVKDKDKDSKGQPGAAAELAAQKLNPQQAAGGPQEQ